MVEPREGEASAMKNERGRWKRGSSEQRRPGSCGDAAQDGAGAGGEGAVGCHCPDSRRVGTAVGACEAKEQEACQQASQERWPSRARRRAATSSRRRLRPWAADPQTKGSAATENERGGHEQSAVDTTGSPPTRSKPPGSTTTQAAPSGKTRERKSGCRWRRRWASAKGCAGGGRRASQATELAVTMKMPRRWLRYAAA